MSTVELKKAVQDRINTMSPEELKHFVEGLLENLFQEPQEPQKEAKTRDINAFILQNTEAMIEKHRSLLNRLAQ